MVLEKHFPVMQGIRVRLFANFREFAGTKELLLEGYTVRDILEKMCRKFPGFEKMLFKDDNLLPYVNVFFNGKNILESGGLDAPLENGDEVAIFPPVSGG